MGIINVLKLTIARFFSPNGNPVNKIGVQPHIQTNTGMDEQAALLLLGSSGSLTDKRGFLKYSVGTMEYEVNLKDARTLDNWQAYSAILKGLGLNNSNFKIGTRSGWREVPQGYWNKEWMLYYPDYEELPELKNVPRDKKFLISFNRPVSVDTIDSNSIELIHSLTGKRITMEYEQVEEKSIKAIPSALLAAGQSYYLIIDPSIRDTKGFPMKDGAIVQVSVSLNN